MEDYVGSLFHKGVGNGLGSGGVIEAARVIYKHLHFRFNILSPCLVSCCETVDKGIIHTADESDGLSVSQLVICLFLLCQGCQGACQKRSLLLLTGIGSYIWKIRGGIQQGEPLFRIRGSHIGQGIHLLCPHADN